jgi:hypothetical protein
MEVVKKEFGEGKMKEVVLLSSGVRGNGEAVEVGWGVLAPSGQEMSVLVWVWGVEKLLSGNDIRDAICDLVPWAVWRVAYSVKHDLKWLASILIRYYSGQLGIISGISSRWILTGP